MLSRWALYATLALMPIFFIPTVVVTIPQAKFGLLTLGLFVAAVCWFIARLAEGRAHVPRNLLFFVAALLPLSYLLSTFFAGFSQSSLVSGLGEQDTIAIAVLWFSALAVTALVMQNSLSSLITLVRAFLVGTGILALFQLLRLFAPSALSLGGVFPNLTTTAAGSWHDLGILLALSLVVSMASLRTPVAAAGMFRIGALMLSALSFLLLIVISMADIWYILAGTAAVMAIHSYFNSGVEHSKAKLTYIAPWVMLAVLGILFGYFNTQIHDRLPAKLKVVAVEVRPSWEGTLAVGQAALNQPRSMFFGSGPNSFSRNWGLYKPEGVNTTLFWNLDFNAGVGAVPTSIVTTGIMGIIAWAAIVAAFLFSLGMVIKNAQTAAASRMMFSVALAALFLLVFEVTYVPGLAVSSLLFIFLGIFIALPRSEVGSFSVPFGLQNLKQLGGAVLVVVPVLVLFVMSGLSFRALASDVSLNRSILAFNTEGNPSAARAHVQTALSLWPSNDRAHRAAVELGIVELARLAQNGEAEGAQQKLQETLTETIQHGLAAVTIDDTDYQNWLTLAQLYQELAGVGMEGAYEQAREAYQEARTDNPTNPVPLYRLGQLESIKGNRAAAIQHLDEALKLKPDFAAAYFLKSQVLAQDNKLDEAITAALSAVQLVQDDPLGWYNLGTILYAKKNWNDAAIAFAQAATLQPDYSNAIFMLGLTLVELKDNTQALAALARVKELNPNDPAVPAIIANIQAGNAPFTGLTQQ